MGNAAAVNVNDSGVPVHLLREQFAVAGLKIEASGMRVVIDGAKRVVGVDPTNGSDGSDQLLQNVSGLVQGQPDVEVSLVREVQRYADVAVVGGDHGGAGRGFVHGDVGVQGDPPAHSRYPDPISTLSVSQATPLARQPGSVTTLHS